MNSKKLFQNVHIILIYCNAIKPGRLLINSWKCCKQEQLNRSCSSGLVSFFTWRNQQFFLTQSFLKDSSEAKTKSGLLSLLIILPDVLLITYLITASIYNTMYLILSHHNIITYLFEHHHYLCPEQKWTSKSIAGVQATNIWTTYFQHPSIVMP